MAAKPAPSFDSSDSFTDILFSDLSIEAAEVSGKDFERCTFRRCKLPESRWENSRLEDCTFEGGDLSRMVPEKLALRGVTFRDARLWGVDWSSLASFPDMGFEKCDLRYSSFVKLRIPRVRFNDCRLAEVNFIEVDLTEADFTGADLLDSTVDGCILTKTNFSRALNVLFDPRKNQVKGTRITVETAAGLALALGFVVE